MKNKLLKKKVIVVSTLAGVLLIAGVSAFTLFFKQGKAHENSNAGKNEVKTSSTTSHVIGYPEGYDTTSEGASSYKNSGDHDNSPYYPKLDVYNMKSTDTLTLISEFETYQQTKEVTCGPSSALMVLNHFGENKYDELEIAERVKCNKDLNGNNKEQPGVANERGEIGTATDRMVEFFKEIGWEVQSSVDEADKDGYSFQEYDEFKDFTIKNLKENTPIMIEWIDWSGHWATIIGYDTMGTESTADDVLILADPYDTSDHAQDGYQIYSAPRFFYMWLDTRCLPEELSKQQWVVAKPTT